MKKIGNIQFLWYGSKSKKGKIIPKQARGAFKKEDRQFGVYATDKKERAITMALIHLKGVKGPTMLNSPHGKVQGIIFDGWPTQDKFYLYKLSSKYFKKIDNWQWISKKEIKPLETKELKTSDYLHLLRKGTKKDRQKFNNLRKKWQP